MSQYFADFVILSKVNEGADSDSYDIISQAISDIGHTQYQQDVVNLLELVNKYAREVRRYADEGVIEYFNSLNFTAVLSSKNEVSRLLTHIRDKEGFRLSTILMELHATLLTIIPTRSLEAFAKLTRLAITDTGSISAFSDDEGDKETNPLDAYDRLIEQFHPIWVLPALVRAVRHQEHDTVA